MDGCFASQSRKWHMCQTLFLGSNRAYTPYLRVYITNTFGQALFEFISAFFIPLVDALLTCSTQLSDLLATLSTSPSAEILDSLRGLERKTSLVFTLLKASVYSIVLQQQIFGDEGEAGGPAPTLEG